MDVLAINSSPRTDGLSKTEMMLDHLVTGMRAAGARVDTIHLREKTIKTCIGCFTCWTQTPGICVHADDMTKEIFPKFKQADIAVYATPLYYHTMNSAMSRFRERTLPMVTPNLDALDDGITFHPLRHKYPAAVWLSVCGFPEISEFDALSTFLNHTKRHYERILAEIYRPSSEMMSSKIAKHKNVDIFAATQSAGRELIDTQSVSQDTLDRISQPFMGPELFRKVSNDLWDSCLREGAMLRHFHKDKMVPRAQSLDTFLVYLAAGLNTDAVKNRVVTLQFCFQGDIKQYCFFRIESGHVHSQVGRADDPDIVIETPFDLWLDIMTKKADGSQMFIENQYSVRGDLELLLELFSPDDD